MFLNNKCRVLSIYVGLFSVLKVCSAADLRSFRVGEESATITTVALPAKRNELLNEAILKIIASENLPRRSDNVPHNIAIIGDITTQPLDEMLFDETIDVDLDGGDFIESIPSFIERGLIPGMNTNNLYIEDISSDTSGGSKQQIILIGKLMPDEKPKVIYVLKKTSKENEIDHIKEAYEHWSGRRVIKRLKGNKNGVMSASVTTPSGELKKYKLKLAWHERIFRHVNRPGEYYELLHAAQGQSMKSMEIYLHEVLFLERENNRIIGEDEEGQMLRMECSEITWSILNEELKRAFVSGTLEQFNGVLEENKQLFNEEPQIERAISFKKKYIKSSHCFPTVIFETVENTPMVVSGIDWEKAANAYEALGAVMGKIFKEYNLNLDDQSLDPHHDNLFFDEKNNTITLIDLEYLGARLTNNNKRGRNRTLDFALNNENWQGIFRNTKDLGIMGGGNIFYHGVKTFYPDADAAMIEKLKEERNRLFDNIKHLYESFAEAFIQNYKPKEAKEVRRYFRDNYEYLSNGRLYWMREPDNVVRSSWMREPTDVGMREKPTNEETKFNFCKLE